MKNTRVPFHGKWLILFLCFALLFCSLSLPTLLRERRERAVLLHVYEAASEFDVPVAMILSVIRTESDFKKEAVSVAGAMGLMQLLPQTFYWLRDEMLCEQLPDTAITQAAVNIRYGTYYLSYLYARFPCWNTALAAYNAGEGRVALWLEDADIAQNGVLVHIPFPETAAYVEETLAAYEKYLVKYPPQGENHGR